ncbi:hypothetical protein CORC01_05612 [Colletotrichum orchidophilum]|uniref:Uncharacterized protein n=1 Tax=Colletotrichum orchidophilum TaxID=1209926 RepID=A0A1G4BCG7_9PEZI|nr:uncharacterized protein CORC01_05612 [Colletotrichum orchidophilum]OHE99119.1 hypothetical protein CORC01_05612 [Colletotrichum orchidophilum]
MRSVAATVLLAAANVMSAQDTVGFVLAFSLGPTQSCIREATTTLILPLVPSPHVQALAVSSIDPKANCGASVGQ